ncbi:choice-of-anchor D domain-containing protein [bacterium]|nr:choice-of-anchor D domain-containing protein [bacterium]
MQAHESRVLQFPYTSPNDRKSFVEATAEQYSAISSPSASNDDEWVTVDPTPPEATFLQLDMVVQESVDQITSIEFTFEGYSSGNQDRPHQIWIQKAGQADAFAADSWVALEPNLVIDRQTTTELIRVVPQAMTGFTSFADFINSETGVIRWGVFAQRINSSIGKQMHVNYVSMKVSYESDLDMTRSGLIGFGLVPIGQTSIPPVHSNIISTSGSLRIDSIELSGPNSAQFILALDNPVPMVLLEGQQTGIDLTFAPNASPAIGKGIQTALVTVTTDSEIEPENILRLEGTGGAQEILVSPEVLDFGDVDAVGTDGNPTKSLGVDIENTGVLPLTVDQLQIVGPDASEFTILNNVTGPIEPGVIVTIGIEFDPDSLGPKTAELIITHDVYPPPEPPTSVPLLGNGAQVCDTISTDLLDFGIRDIDAGPTSTQDVTFAYCNATIITDIVIAGLAADQFNLQSFVALPAAFNPGDVLSVSVNFDPDSVGEKHAVLQVIPQDTMTSSGLVALNGIGIIPTPTPSPTPTPTPLPTPQLLINEVDADTLGTVDRAEFIEIFNGGFPNTPLDGFAVVVYADNSSSPTVTQTFDLDGEFTTMDGYFVLGGENLSVTPAIRLTTNTLPNDGAAIGLYHADAIDFPVGSAPTTAALVDAIVFVAGTGTVSQSSPIMNLLNPGQPVVDESAGGDVQGHSSQRCPNGWGGTRNTDAYSQYPPTVRAPNSYCPTPTPSPTPSPTPYDTQGVVEMIVGERNADLRADQNDDALIDSADIP